MQISLPITHEQALELVKKYNSDERDLIHYLESEAVCKALAEKLGEDKEYFGMLGLLHDIDWGITKDNVQTHLTKAPNILKEAGFDEEFIELLISHGYGFDCANLQDKKRTEKKQFILAAGETVTGLIHAYALMRPEKLEGMKANSLMKKFKDKNFASGVEREIILECEKLKLSLEEFFEIAIRAIQSIKEKAGLV
ncbi:MAG: HDIG domain-containing metalloprotein [Nanoarchaeota archaeon]